MSGQQRRRWRVAVSWSVAVLILIWCVAFALPGQLYEIIAGIITICWAWSVRLIGKRL